MTDYSKMTDDELSAAVAEKVMGWKREQIEHAHKIAAVCAAFNQSAGNEEAQADLRADLTELDRTATPGRCILMNYAGSWDAAGEVVEKMRADGWNFCLESLVQPEYKGSFYKTEGVGHFYDARDKSASRALCIAALAATEGASNAE